MSPCALAVVFALAFQPVSRAPPSTTPTRPAVGLRAARPILQEEDDNVRARPSVEEIRSGSGFIDGRPPDDIDKLMTFSFSEVPLTGQVLLGLGGLLFVLLAGFLVFS